MPKLVTVDKSRAQRGPTRKYRMDEHIQTALQSPEQGLYFTHEEMVKDYNVKAQAVSSAVRKDAESLTERLVKSGELQEGQTINIWIRLVDRDGENGTEQLIDPATGKHAQDLVFKATLRNADGSPVTVNATEDGSDNSETAEAPAETGKGRRR